MSIRVGVDVGGTFTDAVLEAGTERVATKTLTTPEAPEDGVLRALGVVLEMAGVGAADVAVIIHGTTLATNALIERKGAPTALITTAGFRDTIEIRHEHRFEQYDVDLDLPLPLVPRRLRFGVPERIDARGRVLVPLDEAAVAEVLDALDREQVESIAVGLLHSFTNGAHEQRIGEMIAARLPGVSVSLSSEVSPEMREYERFSTACANAYVRPRMARYLTGLERRLEDAGFACPLLLMTSSGGLTTVETAARYPVRLVESGPAGGALFAAHLARLCALDDVLSFDMGGTTAKLCVVDQARPQTARSFEVARVYRFKKGSGLPIRVPVIEMVEIGAGGGSIARRDALGKIAVGPDSAGADPGPACYGLGGSEPTVTDADLVLGRIDADSFAGGRLVLDAARARSAIETRIAGPLGLSAALGAFGIAEMVDENMVNAARVHLIESGKSADGRVLVAFGGAAPLHACRVAEKLGIARVLVPAGAGVGSAVGFLRAPAAHERVQSDYQLLSRFDAERANRVLGAMRAEAEAIVRRAAPEGALEERRAAFMRYRGQGHEIGVPIPVHALDSGDGARLAETFAARYRDVYGRHIPDMDVEVLSWVLVLAAPIDPWAEARADASGSAPSPRAERAVFDPELGEAVDMPVYWREDLGAGARIAGPAVIAEAQTATLVGRGFEALVNDFGHIDMARRGP